MSSSTVTEQRELMKDFHVITDYVNYNSENQNAGFVTPVISTRGPLFLRRPADKISVRNFVRLFFLTSGTAA